MKKHFLSLYIVLFFLICAVPAAGMFFSEREEVKANQMLAQKPVLKGENGWNSNYLRELEQYVSDHFAFRQELITANAALMTSVFHVTGTEDVVLGKDGWLFYRETLDDFSAVDNMTPRQIYAASKNLSLMQEALEKEGKEFLFTIAPNKSSVCPQYMPYYARKTGARNNAELLTAELKKQAVSYVDLFGPLREDGRLLYHRLDSHWTNEGAAVAGRALLKALHRERDAFQGKKTDRKQDFPGDLYEMVYPKGTQKDWQTYYRRPFAFQYKEPFGGVTDITIKTTNKEKTGSLFMYRDSFGNALIPFMAESCGKACFSRQSQYDLTTREARDADTVIVEIVERNLPQLASCQPIFEAPVRQWGLRLEEAPKASFSIAQEDWNQELVKLSGSFIYCQLDADSDIYVDIGGTCYEAAPVSESDEKEGYALYVQKKKLVGKERAVRIAYKSAGQYLVTKEKTITFGGNEE